MAGATSVTVVPLVTTVVGLSVVVSGAADVNGVFSAVDSAGDADPAEVGLLDGVPIGVVAAGAEAEAEIVGGPAGGRIDAPSVVG